jgi:hypothetical protein
MRPPVVLLAASPLFASDALAQDKAPHPPLAPLPPAPTMPAPSAQSPEGPPAPSPLAPSESVIVVPAPQASPEPPVLSASPPASTAPAWQPKPFVHDGFYFGVGSGFAHIALGGNGPNGSVSISGLGSTSTLAIGGTVARGLAIAGTVEGATRSGSDFKGGPTYTATDANGHQTPLGGHASAAVFLLGAMADWYPAPEGGWHVGGAVGLGGASITDDAANAIAGISIGLSAFGGYQWWLGRSWSLGVSGFVLGTPSVKGRDSGGNDTGYSFAPIAGGIQSLLLYY